MSERRDDQVKCNQRRTQPSYKEFGSSALHLEFARHVKAAQDAFLRGDNATAEREATQALRFRPTAHLFALMAVVAESKGQYDRASDFRLLQAFLAKDTVLWEELLHEFLSQQLYYKSVVCLQRLSALEKSDAERYRTLQLQLADLLVGLGEIRRAATVLVALWNRSRCRDFEVFAQLAALYFQLGKWNSLEGLIASSLQYAFRVERHARTDVAGAAQEECTPPARRAGTKRVRFDDDDDSGDNGGDVLSSKAKPEDPGVKIEAHDRKAEQHRNWMTDTPHTAEEIAMSPADDFGFDELMPESGESLASPASPASSSPAGRSAGAMTPLTSQQADRATQSLRKHYGDQLVLHTDEEKRNFLTLVNVHTELLNERGKYLETIRLVERTAVTVGVELLDLPPDLLIRLGTAYAYQGELEQPCHEVFQHLVETCSMDEYGDVLLDAATTLQKVGMHREALQLFETITRYHEFRLQRLREEKAAIQAELAIEAPDATITVNNNNTTDSTDLTAAQPSLASLLKQVQSPSHTSPHAQSLRAQLVDLTTEESELATVVATGFYGQARCQYALRDHAQAEVSVRKTLLYEPPHLQGRLLLGRLRFYDANDVDGAVAALTPMASDPGLHRLQLGAALVGVFKRANKLVEAIALGVSIFELILSSSEDGDTESVAPGSVGRRRGSVKLYMPALSRASSAIIPASSLATMLHGPGASVAATTHQRLSSSIAASVKAGSTVFTQQLRRRGMSALTTTVYGASAAASMAAGWEREQEEARLQDSSTIFRFSRRRGTRRARTLTTAPDTPDEASQPDPTTLRDVEGETSERGEDGDVGTDADATTARRWARAEALLHMPAKEFWDSTDAEADTGTETKAETGALDATKREEDEGTHKGDGEDHTEPHSRSATLSSVRKRDRPAADQTRPLAATLANMSTEGAREHDLAELEAFAQAAETEASTKKRRRREDQATPSSATLVDQAATSLTGIEENGGEHDGSAVDEEDEGTELASYELPSLDEISQQFDDPVVSQLFLDATANFSLHGGEQATRAGGHGADPWAAAHQVSHATAFGGGVGGTSSDALSPELHKVTMREAVEALGRTELVTLATTVVECYSLLGHFTEAKEFAYMTLVKLAKHKTLRRSGQGIERPLRTALLQSALAAREAEDAFRVGLNLLLQDSTDEEKITVIELLHRVLNVCGPTASGGVLLHAVMEGQNEVPMVVLLANRYYLSGSYLAALNLYVAALSKRPEDALLNWMTGLLFLLVSHQRRIRSREACISAGVYYVQRYETLVTAATPARTGEAVYNVARVFQYLRLNHLCLPLYRRVATDLPVPSRCSLALQRAARFNVYYLLRWHSGNRTLALSMLPFAEGRDDDVGVMPEANVPCFHSPFA